MKDYDKKKEFLCLGNVSNEEIGKEYFLEVDVQYPEKLQERQ